MILEIMSMRSFYMQKYISQSGLEVVPAGLHKPCNVGSSPTFATAGWSGEAPAEPHKLCNVGSNPTPATHRDVAQVVARGLGPRGCWFKSSHSDLEHDEQWLIERGTEFNVYSIIKTTSYNARDGTSQTNG